MGVASTKRRVVNEKTAFAETRIELLIEEAPANCLTELSLNQKINPGFASYDAWPAHPSHVLDFLELKQAHLCERTDQQSGSDALLKGSLCPFP